MRAKQIKMPRQSFLYLRNIQNVQRTGKPFVLSDSAIRNLERKEAAYPDRLIRVMDGGLGGCRGPAENSWEEHRWTTWSCAEMEKMLDKRGLPWKPAEDIEYIPVYI